ncbi:MAG: EscU/YscU/HrcU family type III secretion system export apparatus switch protein [Acidobacteriia bacterium]|nr:EscU/YscU/HrcU family type III secretion system export apparatus switch protein [Terriglobia bacterium]
MADRFTQTEQPTQRRLDKARREGQFLTARELVGALQFMVFLALLGAGGARWFATFCQTTRRLLEQAFAAELAPADLSRLGWQLFWRNLLPLALAGAAVAAATLAFRLGTTRFGFSLKKLAPDVKRLDPVARLRELPRQNLPALVQAVVLLPVFLAATYWVARSQLDRFLLLPLGTAESGVRLLGASLMDLFWKAAVAFLAFGAADLFRQARRYRRDLRMSKQEVREELKDLEGNPQMKARIRRLQRERLRRQMMKEVPLATAVVVNPTHFAVALRYHMDGMAAPLVVAKGKNYLALRIRQRAVEHQVPIIENPPLAQALYQSVDVGQEIPPHLYRAVAEILAYIFKLMNGTLPGPAPAGHAQTGAAPR